MFWLLTLLVPVAGAFVLSAYRRWRRLQRFGDLETLAPLMPDASPRLWTMKTVLMGVAIVLMICALARPQVGSKLKEVTVRGIELMLVVDVSNSMLAEDFEPSRLERTKYAIGRLLEGLEQDRIGLVVFAGDAYVQLPITSDYLVAQSFVRQISPTMVSKQGTAIGAAIDLAARGFSSESGPEEDGRASNRAIILITDGENHEDDALAAAQRATEKGIKIYTIGIGTPQGAPIRIEDDFIRDENGEMVVSKLDETTLRQIAIETDGAYIRSTQQSLGLEEIISRINETESKEFTTQMFEEYDEQYRYFLFAALVFIIFYYFCPRVKWRIT